jgi:drug/metabolite transporter (DMT)-like permease
MNNRGRSRVMSKDITFNYHLLSISVVYTIAAANEMWLLNWLKTLFEIELPVFAAFLQNASWPIQAVIYNEHRKNQEIPRVVTNSMYKSYCILGTLSTLITLSRTIGITSLPPTIYVICSNTEIVFETILTWSLLRRNISYLQMFAVCLVIIGVMVSLYNPNSGKYGDNENVSNSALVTGVILSLFSRLCSSVNTILAEK